MKRPSEGEKRARGSGPSGRGSLRVRRRTNSVKFIGAAPNTGNNAEIIREHADELGLEPTRAEIFSSPPITRRFPPLDPLSRTPILARWSDAGSPSLDPCARASPAPTGLDARDGFLRRDRFRVRDLRGRVAHAPPRVRARLPRVSLRRPRRGGRQGGRALRRARVPPRALEDAQLQPQVRQGRGERRGDGVRRHRHGLEGCVPRSRDADRSPISRAAPRSARIPPPWRARGDAPSERPRRAIARRNARRARLAHPHPPDFGSRPSSPLCPSRPPLTPVVLPTPPDLPRVFFSSQAASSRRCAPRASSTSRATSR